MIFNNCRYFALLTPFLFPYTTPYVLFCFLVPLIDALQLALLASLLFLMFVMNMFGYLLMLEFLVNLQYS